MTCICFVILCASACKKDSTTPEKEDDNITVNQNGGEIVRFSLVTIDVGDKLLNKEEYKGKIGNVDILLVKSDESELAFIPLENIPEGKQELLIPELNNLRVDYVVKDPVLSQSPQQTIAPFFDKLTRLEIESADTAAIYRTIFYNIRHVQEMYQTATTEQQRIMAMMYQANKPMFDAAFEALEDMKQSRIQRQPVSSSAIFMSMSNNSRMPIGMSELKASRIRSIKETVSTRQFIMLNVWIHTARLSFKTFAAIWKTPPHWHAFIPAAGAVLSIYAGMKTAELSIDVSRHNIQFSFFKSSGSTQKTPQTSNSKITDGLKASSHSAGAETLFLRHDVTEAFPFYFTGRKLQQSDRNSSTSAVGGFFNVFDTFVGMITGVNEGLSWLNNKVTFANFRLIPVVTIPEHSAVDDLGTPSDILEHLSFSIDHQNLELSGVDLSETGDLLIKAKIVNTDDDNIQGELKFKYKDELNSFEGAVRIEIKKEEEFDIVGVWRANEVYSDRQAGPLNLSGKNLLNYFYSYNYFEILPSTSPFRNCPPLMYEQRLDEYILQIGSNGRVVETRKGHQAAVGTGNYSRCADFQNSYVKGAYNTSIEYTYVYDVANKTLTLTNQNGNTFILNIESNKEDELLLTASTSFMFNKLVLSKPRP